MCRGCCISCSPRWFWRSTARGAKSLPATGNRQAHVAWVRAVWLALRLVYLLSVSVALLVGGVARLVTLAVPGTMHASAAALIGLAALLGGCATTVLTLRHCPDFSETD